MASPKLTGSSRDRHRPVSRGSGTRRRVRIRVAKDPVPERSGDPDHLRQLAGLPIHEDYRDTREVLSLGDSYCPPFQQVRRRQVRIRALPTQVLSQQDPNHKMNPLPDSGDGDLKQQTGNGKANDKESPSSQNVVKPELKDEDIAGIPAQSDQSRQEPVQEEQTGQDVIMQHDKSQVVIKDKASRGETISAPAPVAPQPTQPRQFPGHHAQTQSPPFRVQKASSHRRTVSFHAPGLRAVGQSLTQQTSSHRRIVSHGGAPTVQLRPQQNAIRLPLYQPPPLTQQEAIREAELAAGRAAQYAALRERYPNLRRAEEALQQQRARQAGVLGVQPQKTHGEIRARNLQPPQRRVQPALVNVQNLGGGGAQARGTGRWYAGTREARLQRVPKAKLDARDFPIADRQHRPVRPRPPQQGQQTVRQVATAHFPVAQSVLQAIALVPIAQPVLHPQPRQPQTTAPPAAPIPPSDHANNVLRWQRQFADTLQAGAEDPGIVANAKNMTTDELHAAATLLALGRPVTPPGEGLGDNEGPGPKLWSKKTIEAAIDTTVAKLKAEVDRKKAQEVDGHGEDSEETDGQGDEDDETDVEG